MKYVSFLLLHLPLKPLFIKGNGETHTECLTIKYKLELEYRFELKCKFVLKYKFELRYKHEHKRSGETYKTCNKTVFLVSGLSEARGQLNRQGFLHQGARRDV